MQIQSPQPARQCSLYLLSTVDTQGPGKRWGFCVNGGDAMTQKPCPRCKKLIPCGMAYCEECKASIAEARAKSRTPQTDNDKRCRAFYRSAPWKRTSAAKLASVLYRCEAQLPGCQGTATETHHIKPIQTPDGWALRLDWDNLEAVCVRCHNRRHDR